MEWKFPSEVSGWLTEQEGRFLADCARGMDTLELGCYAGRSSICMAQTAKSLICVDSFLGTGTAEPRDTYVEFCANLARYGFDRKLTVFRGMFSICVRQLPRDSIDFALIDGSHQFDDVCNDINLVLSVLKPSGLIAFHDYQSPIDPDVTAAVNAYLAQGAATLVTVVGTVALIRPHVKAVPTADVEKEKGDGYAIA